MVRRLFKKRNCPKKDTIKCYFSRGLKEGELEKDSIVKNYFTTATDGKDYNVAFYTLDMVLAIGFRVRSKRGTQFRIWANQNLKISNGLLAVIEIEHDNLSEDVPPIKKGTDGRALK